MEANGLDLKEVFLKKQEFLIMQVKESEFLLTHHIKLR